MFSLGLPCLKVRNDVQSPAGLAVSSGITFYNALAARLLSLQQGQTWAACDRGERGLSIQFSACYPTCTLAGMMTRAERSMGRSTGLVCESTPFSTVQFRQSRELVKGGIS